MGNYVFSTEALLDALHTDAADESSKHDMGGNIVPMLTAQSAAQVYDFQSNEVPGETAGGERYWRDVGTIDSYFDAHMDLCEVVPASTSTTTAGRSSPTSPRTRRRSSCTTTATGWAGRSTASSPTA